MRGNLHGNAFIGLLRTDILRSSHYTPVPRVFPVARRNPNIAARFVRDELENWSHKCVIEENILRVVVSSVFCVFRPEQVATANKRETTFGRLVTSCNQRWSQLVTGIQVVADNIFCVIVIAPWSVITAMEAVNGAKRTVSRPAHETSASDGSRVAAAIAVHIWFEVVDTRVDHRLNRTLQRNSVTSPPNRESMLSWRFGVPSRWHPRAPIWQPKLRQCHGTLVKGIACWVTDSFVELTHSVVVDMRTPGCVVQVVPFSTGDGGVDHRRWNRECPVVIEPPKCKSAIHPF